MKKKEVDKGTVMQNYKKLKVWERSHKLCLKVYQLTSEFSEEEKYGIISQLRRATVSIPTKIAEGSGRSSNKDFNRFLQISLGSASEVEYIFYLSRELKFIREEQYLEIENNITEIKKMLSGLMSKVISA